MKERELSEQESLAIITQMIANAQANIKAKLDGSLFLVWGYVTVAIAIGIWLIRTFYSIWQINFVWFLVPVICFPTYFYLSQKQKVITKSYIDRIINAVAVIFALACIVTAIPNIWIYYPALFFEAILLSSMMLIIGAIIRNKIIMAGGTIGLLFSISFLAIPAEYELLVFALFVFIVFIVPGHLFKRTA